MISLLLARDLPEAEKNNIPEIQYIDNSLEPRKHNILYLLKEDFEETPGIKNILAKLRLTKKQYYNAFSISSGSDFQIHIKRAPNSCFVNNIFTEGLQA